MEIRDKKVLESVKKRYKDCDFTELSYEEIFNVLRQTLVYAFDDVLTFYITGINQVKLCNGETYVCSDRYGNVPAIDLHINVTQSLADYSGDFCLTITPYDCYLDNLKKDAGVYGWRDNVITQIWRDFMRKEYKEAYLVMFNAYFKNKKAIKDEEAKLAMERKLILNEKEYENEISTIV